MTQFSTEEKRGLYRAIYERRDVRSHFLPDPVPDDVLARVLDAAHHAPSVGFMQPWDFIVIRDVMPVAEMGWLSIFIDPTGATLGLWQAKKA